LIADRRFMPLAAHGDLPEGAALCDRNSAFEAFGPVPAIVSSYKCRLRARLRVNRCAVVSLSFL